MKPSWRAKRSIQAASGAMAKRPVTFGRSGSSYVDRLALSPAQECEGESFEVERMDSADSPVAVDCLHCHGHRQHHRARPRRWNASSAVDHVLAAAAACVTHVHRTLYVRAAICSQVAHQEEAMTKAAVNRSQQASKLISARI